VPKYRKKFAVGASTEKSVLEGGSAGAKNPFINVSINRILLRSLMIRSYASSARSFLFMENAVFLKAP
jgi:hypothetical protein